MLQWLAPWHDPLCSFGIAAVARSSSDTAMASRDQQHWFAEMDPASRAICQHFARSKACHVLHSCSATRFDECRVTVTSPCAHLEVASSHRPSDESGERGRLRCEPRTTTLPPMPATPDQRYSATPAGTGSFVETRQSSLSRAVKPLDSRLLTRFRDRAGAFALFGAMHLSLRVLGHYGGGT